MEQTRPEAVESLVWVTMASEVTPGTTLPSMAWRSSPAIESSACAALRSVTESLDISPAPCPWPPGLRRRFQHVTRASRGPVM